MRVPCIPPNQSLPAREAGYTLVEVLVSALLLVIGMLGVLMMVDTGNRKSADNMAREQGTGLAREIAERSREIPYASLQMDANDRPATLLALPGLATSGGSGTWQIQHRNVTYTVSTYVCKYDDPTDGINSRDPGFCDLTNGGGGGSGSTGTASGLYADLTALGLNINVDLSGGGTQALCNILGANPALNNALGGVASLVAAGADIAVCSTTSGDQVTVDRNNDDMKRVRVTVQWQRPGGTEQIVQSTLIPNPSGGAPLT